VLRALDRQGGLRERLGRPLDNQQLGEALALVRADGAVSAALDTARGYSSRAVAALGPVGDNAATSWLASTTDALFARVDAVSATS
jgi:geranylgeranyl pyrophosphate synthase